MQCEGNCGFRIIEHYDMEGDFNTEKAATKTSSCASKGE